MSEAPEPELTERLGASRIGARRAGTAAWEMRPMVEPSGPSPGRIFISYRREETAYPAGWLFDRLTDRFDGQVFKDVDSIEPGDDWVEVITRVVGSCDVLLALIGDQWLTITDEDGHRRLDNPHDFVRLEIEAALTRNVRVIPVLVEGARMPRAAELPSSLAKLARRQALVLSPANFDTSRLVGVLDRTLAKARTTAATMAPADETQDRDGSRLLEAPERSEPAESTPTSRVPPAAPATDRELWRDDVEATGPKPGMDEAEFRPARDHPRARHRYRLSRRAWMILVGAGVALLLLGGVVVVLHSGQGTGSVIFEDDFSSQASGWTAFPVESNGEYQNGAYQLSAGADSDTNSVPTAASSVYKVAPASINIEVETQIIAGDARYGVNCRQTDTWWYTFIVQGDSASIWRHEGSSNEQLATGTAQVDLDSTNELFATCEGGEDDEGQPYVYLQLLVNGETVAHHTDETPLPAGSVGLRVHRSSTSQTTQVQFDNFVVTHV